jgi:uncharacterized protein (TIGR00369 family)
MDSNEESRRRTLAAMAAVKQSHEAGDHLAKLMGMYDVEESEERMVIDLPVTPQLSNIRGALQGGFVSTLADIAAGRLAMKGVRSGQSTATLDLTVHFLLPIVEGPARATATFIRRGKRTVVIGVDIVDVARDRLAATATVQFIVLDMYTE